MAKVDIVNVVATASLNQSVDFNELVKCKEIIYSSSIYGGRVAYFKTEKMQGKVSIFVSGKMISVGTKSKLKAFGELVFAMTFLAAEGLIKTVELTPKIQNLVATADFGKSVNLENLAQNSKAIYEPEQFPGVILRIIEPFKTSVLIFASGKAVITGLKNEKQIEPIVNILSNLIDMNQ
jgi:transcription initiation factor TFIID TATA-box-binding protein